MDWRGARTEEGRPVSRRIQQSRDSTAVTGKLEPGGHAGHMDRPGAVDIMFGAKFFCKCSVLHVPCGFKGHIWLFSTVMRGLLWLIRTCPKYMVYFLRIWIEKNPFSTKSLLVCWEQRLVEPLSHGSSQTVVDSLYYWFFSLGCKGRHCQSLSSLEPTLACWRSSINLLNVLNSGLAREHQVSLLWSLLGLCLYCGRDALAGWQA